MSATAMNGGDAAKSSSPAPSGSKQQFKSGKSQDIARKQSPIDGQNKKQQQPKAWQGPNPITQRASTNLANGNEKPLPKAPSQQQASQSKNGADLHCDKHAHDRSVFLFAHFTGKDVTLSLKNGEQFSGVFSGCSLEPNKSQYVLKMVRRIRSAEQQVNGDSEAVSEYIGEGEDHVVSFDIQDTVDLHAQQVSLAAAAPQQNGSIESSFRTDTQISSRDQHMPRERELQRWMPGPETEVDLSLESSGATGEWDQFAANESRFGVQSTYDEDLYTTSINRSKPGFNRLQAEADRIAREIEGSAPTNAHVAEERRRDAQGGDDMGDEEEKYSGVKRETILPKRAAGAYVPPSQRPISNTPSVPGAPFDPAIISSQIAKPATTTDKAPAAQPSAQPAPTAPAGVTSESSAASAALPQVPKKKENTTEDRVRDTADAFKHFANTEKLRIRQAQEAKRVNQRQEKNVKLNDLKKFAENFKLKSRVPDDLVPILAKDREKQIEIQAKADQAAIEGEANKSKDKAGDKPSSAASPATSTATAQTGPPSAVDPRLPFNNQQQQHSRSRMSGNVRGAPAGPGQGPSPGRPNLSTRIQQNNNMFNRTMQPLPADLQIPPPNRAAAGDTPMSPSSATRLNVNAKSFEFRPAASEFNPTGTTPSPQHTGSNVGTSPAEAPSNFFDEKKKDTKSSSGFDPLKRMSEAEYNEVEKKKFQSNGNLPQAYNTLPTWPNTKMNENKMFRDTFPSVQAPSQGPSPMQTPNPNSQMPHAHQLPAHLQPNMSNPSQRPPYYGQPSHGHGPSFDPRLQPQFGPNGSVQNSPRAQQMPVPFNGQMPPMPVQQFPGQGMQGYGMSPSMQYRQPSLQGGPQMMMPGQMQGQMGPMQPGYPQGPQFRGGPQMGGHMMMQQPSGGYANGPMPQQQGFSPMPPHAQPHMPHMQHGGPAGYASSPRPPMMQHGGSHQGFQPGMQMQPHFAPSPGQPHPYHVQQGRAMSSGFPQMTPRQQHAVPNHPSPGMGGVAAQGDEGK